MQTFDESKFMAAVAHLLGAVSVAITNVTSGTARSRSMTVSFVATMPQYGNTGAMMSSLTDEAVTSHFMTEGMPVKAAHVVMPPAAPPQPLMLNTTLDSFALNNTGQAARNAVLADCEGCSVAHEDKWSALLWVLLAVLIALLGVVVVVACMGPWFWKRPVAGVKYSFDRTKKLKL